MENFDSSFFRKESNTPAPRPTDNKLSKSTKKWSLELLEVTLHPSFGGFINQILGRDERIHFVSFSWDYNRLSHPNESYLNFVGNCSPMELNPGNSHTYQNGGLSLFPNRRVIDSLNLALFVFNNKNDKKSVDPLMDEIGNKINSSLLSQELAELTEENTVDRKEYIVFLADQLKQDIETMITDYGTKHISTFSLKYDVNDNSKFVGMSHHLQNFVRVCFNKRKL
jgi:hypothetical protein